MGNPQEARDSPSCVTVEPRDLPGRIDGVGDGTSVETVVGARASTRSLQDRHYAVRRAHEPAIPAWRCVLVADDRPCRVDCKGERPRTAWRRGIGDSIE